MRPAPKTPNLTVIVFRSLCSAGLVAGLDVVASGLPKRNERINSQGVEYLFHIVAIDISVSLGLMLVSTRQRCHVLIIPERTLMADNKSKTPFYLIDTSSAFYKPLSRRLVICLTAILWMVLETWHRDPFWSVISAACAAYCVYTLFWAYKTPEDVAPVATPASDEEPTEAGAAPAIEIAADRADDDKPKS
jgi:hypothetical protein